MPTKIFTLGVVWEKLKLDLNMQIGKTHKRNMQHNTTQNQKDKNKFLLSYKYAHTHTNKITEIILGKDIYQSNIDLLDSSSLFMVPNISVENNKTMYLTIDRFQNKNRRPRCIKVENVPLILCERIYRPRQIYCNGWSGATYFPLTLKKFVPIGFAKVCFASSLSGFFTFFICCFLSS